ncbi:MAG: hypothetical protein KA779_09380 [Propionivibrio sp.]|nr:hypothetical protein [Propionivibrio sp.]MBP6712014.1 hypothetical protein [Propionivibrio sp.]MBP7524959.1 hypothetical protein [Propionivibrio sp.]
MKMLRITLQGKTYEVGVEVLDTASGSTVAAPAAPVAAPVAPVAVAAPAPAVAAPVAAPAAPAPAVAGGHPVTSPMPGTVMKITTAVGQHVTKDQELLILEAMKMESPVYAPCDGTVASILVKEADAVVEGQVLVQLS